MEPFETVEKAASFPGMCAVSCATEGPFLDLRTLLAESGGCYGYLHVSVAEQVGISVGMVPRREVESVVAQAREMALEIEALQAQLDAIDALQQLQTA